MNGYASKSDRKIAFAIVGAVIVATMWFVVSWFIPRGDVVHIEYGPHTIAAKVAKDDASRQVGLGGVRQLGPNEGLLMVFENPGSHRVWMAGMEIPIDVVWVGEDGEIVHIVKDMKPESYPTEYSSKRPAKYVLEIGSGMASRINISVGGYVRLPGEI